MTDRVRRTALGIALLLALSVVSVPPVEAAAPQLLMVYGGGLTEPVILGDWDENLAFLLATSGSIDVPTAELAGRPFHSLALFWGGEWSRYMAEGGSLATLRPEQANQQGASIPHMAPARPFLSWTPLVALVGSPAVPILTPPRYCCGTVSLQDR